jgi:hypothetical protein
VSSFQQPAVRWRNTNVPSKENSYPDLGLLHQGLYLWLTSSDNKSPLPPFKKGGLKNGNLQSPFLKGNLGGFVWQVIWMRLLLF